MQDFKIIEKKQEALEKSLARKSHFRRAFIFLTIFALLMAGLSQSIQQILLMNDSVVNSRHKNMYGISKEDSNSIDMVILGDSLSYTSFSPMLLWENQGITSYDCGQSGQKIQESYYMLQRVLKTQSPKVLLMETNTLFRGESSKVEDLKDTIEAWENYHLSLFRGHDIWKSVLSGKNWTEKDYKGFAFRCTRASYTGGKYMKKTKAKAEMPEMVIKYMKKIQKLCKENHIQLILVSAPSPVNYSYAKHNTLTAYAKENGLEYLDLNLKLKEVGINWKTDSLDGGDHLNLSGAQRVTSYVGKYLQKVTELVDHRGDKSYASWKKEAKKYQKKADRHLKKIRKTVKKKQKTKKATVGNI